MPNETGSRVNRVGRALRQRLGAAAVVLTAACVIPTPAHGASHLTGVPPLCPFRLLTGLPCPGCGMTRSLVCLGHGQVAESFAFHPLGFAIFGLLTVSAAARLLGWSGRIAPKLWETIVCVTIAALLVVWAARLGHLLPYPP